MIRKIMTVNSDCLEGFENLIYLSPEVNCHIKVDTLSEDQKAFLDANLLWSDDDRFSHSIEKYKHLYYYKDLEWYLTDEISSTEISFNDIFIDFKTLLKIAPKWFTN